MYSCGISSSVTAFPSRLYPVKMPLSTADPFDRASVLLWSNINLSKFKNIIQSVLKLRFSTYHTSLSNCSCHDQTWPSCTRGGHSSPGFTASRIRCLLLYRRVFSGGNGRGPIMLISPLKMLQKLRSSSSEVLRTSLPNCVTLLSGGNNSPRSSFVFRILRNLIRTKISPSFPARFCLNSIGAPTSIKVAIPRKRLIGSVTSRAIPDNKMSIARFPYREYRETRGSTSSSILFTRGRKSAAIASASSSLCSLVSFL